MGIDTVKAVFLDRDGVLNVMYYTNGVPRPPDGLRELVIYPDVPDALRRLKEAGYLLLVVTNQPDVARGVTSMELVNEINVAMAATLPLDDFLVCAHDNAHGCNCRKPKPGMVLEGAARYHVDLARSFMVGDRWRDIDCGTAAGVRTVLIDRGHKEQAPQKAPDFVTDSLAGAAAWILKQA
ncbi:MAG: HAD family hydrolase [Candidatus Solibacter sp.]